MQYQDIYFYLNIIKYWWIEKTKIVYCKKDRRNLGCYPVQFDFLGFSFQPLRIRLKGGGSFLQFDCKMSHRSKSRILEKLRNLGFHKKSYLKIQDLVDLLNPMIRGWANYYGRVSMKSLTSVFYHLHHQMCIK